MNTVSIQSLISAGDAAAGRIQKAAQLVLINIHGSELVYLPEGAKLVGISAKASCCPDGHQAISAAIKSDPNSDSGNATINGVA